MGCRTSTSKALVKIELSSKQGLLTTGEAKGRFKDEKVDLARGCCMERIWEKGGKPQEAHGRMVPLAPGPPTSGQKKVGQKQQDQKQ